jgi:hypothetical protein
MADGNIEIPPQLSQVEIDELERRIQNERISYNSGWAAFVEPNLSREQAWNQSAIDFTNYGVKLLTTLNGGAIAFSITAASFLNTTPTINEFLTYLSIFLLGLIAGVLALIFGFFACARMAEYYGILALKKGKRLNYDLLDAEDQYTSMILRQKYNQMPFEKENSDTEMRKKAGEYNFWRVAGLSAVFFSAASFVIGIITYASIVAF